MGFTWEEIIREPYWWIRLVQMSLGIFAFFSLCLYSGCASIYIHCGTATTAATPATTDLTTGASTTTTAVHVLSVIQGEAPSTFVTQSQSVCIQFPFRLTDVRVTDYCHGNKHTDYLFHENFDVQADFLMAIIVISVFYSTLAFGLYMKFWQKYAHDTFFQFPDLLVTSCYSAYWLAAIFSFISALISLKDATSAESMKLAVTQLKTCVDEQGDKCWIDRGTWNTYGTLDFLCFIGVIQTLLYAVNAFMIMRRIQITKIMENHRFGEFTAEAGYPQYGGGAPVDGGGGLAGPAPGTDGYGAFR